MSPNPDVGPLRPAHARRAGPAPPLHCIGQTQYIDIDSLTETTRRRVLNPKSPLRAAHRPGYAGRKAEHLFGLPAHVTRPPGLTAPGKADRSRHAVGLLAPHMSDKQTLGRAPGQHRRALLQRFAREAAHVPSLPPRPPPARRRALRCTTQSLPRLWTRASRQAAPPVWRRLPGSDLRCARPWRYPPAP